jgi:hypothetical protein
MPLLAFALPAQAAEPIEVAAVPYRYPTALMVDGAGTHLRLLDAEGHEVPTDDALLLVGALDAADAYARERQDRKNNSTLLWITGGALATTAVLLGGISDGGDAQSLPVTVTLLAAPVAIGSGLFVRFADPKRHLGAWVSADPVEDAVAAHNREVEQHTPMNAEARAAAVADRRIYIDFDGRVVDADRHPVRMNALMQRIDDERTERAWRRQRHRDKATWAATIGVGGGLLGLGAGVSTIGVFMELLGADSHLPEAGAVVMGIGAGGLGVGLTGMFTSKARHDDPGFWYDEPTLREEIDGYTRDLERTYGVRAGARVELHPVIGPGAIGVAGTF